MFADAPLIAPILALSDSLLWGLIFAGIVVVLIVAPRRFAKRSRILDDPNVKRTAHEELRHSMDRLLVELQETARDINATIDTKMIALNRLIAEADRRLEALDAAQAPPEAPEEQITPQPIAKKEVAAPPDPEPTSPEALKRRALEREIYRLADEGKTELEIARLTDTPRGEIELVLSLRKTSDTNDAEDKSAS